MDVFTLLKILSGPLIGAVIGYFTNWMAVKMLFRPRNAIYIGKLHVPFTPGVVPRRKAAFGKALGRMISESLVQKEDLKESLCSEPVCNTIADLVLITPSLRSLGERFVGEGYEGKKDLAVDFVTDKILDGILAMDIGAVISREATHVVSTFAGSNPLIKMFVSDQLIANLSAPIAGKVTEYLQNEGRDKLRETLDGELCAVQDRPLRELVRDTDRFRAMIASFYRTLVNQYADAIVAHFHIASIVGEKVCAMDPRELENLLLMVMKKELNALVWLGVPIGFIMGCVTTIITRI